ncbi:succinate dehydrogenase, cytochrome b556 subunit [Rhodospirillaceae bacterium KN72]|uniref:Succinate dehydrogenase cytochrome b556 subunit n=1 Tax=Pacificispira spongiicola TaxID=2729598 RepID=A0A7Y0E1R4_9PROT|nr:succinate dehydrogenase, cytochrome b556 subunit [Pacificispira spongiicola]NMM45558.1 succinate dehydrogenase, cytochrome b556 subunit [Pacificispira spongiicola]
MTTQDRPLSPHLQVYRWQWTMAYSILHRATGIALGVGTLLLVWWLIALATGPEAFDTVQAVVGSFIGRLFLFGWTFAMFYHLGNGIRHLFWDAGKGFELEIAAITGHAVPVSAAVLTLIAWAIGYAVA